MMNKPELLAPAGSYTSVLAAINAGADAVYLGATQFSARAFANNLTEDELLSAIKLCHLYGVKVYLTLNTLITTNEMESIVPMMRPLYCAGLDGVIIQDLGIVKILADNFPGLSLHASTQMSIMSPYGAEFAASCGIERVVPARELTLDEIREIKEKSGLEVECFIHGAMCYSYSGLCLMSSMIGGRSGNRGKCAGTCRLPFLYSKSGRNAEEYPISMKDMCTVTYIPRLIEAGIDSFKIEGRMKTPEYVAGVTSIYRKYIDMYFDNPSGFAVETADLDFLNGLYIRTDICKGYYEGQRGKNLITMGLPGYRGTDDNLIGSIKEKYVHTPEKIKIDTYVYLHTGEKASITINCNDYYITVNGSEVLAAQNAPLSEERVVKQINKLGDTVFEAENIAVDLSDNAFLPMGDLNELRRKALAGIEQQIIDGYEIGYRDRIKEFADIEEKHKQTGLEDTSDINTRLCISVMTSEQLKVAMTANSDRIIVSYKLLDELKSMIYQDMPEIVISLPAVLRYNRIDIFENIVKKIKLINSEKVVVSGVLVHTLDEAYFAKKELNDLQIISDASVYMFNEKSIEFFGCADISDEITLPLEATLSDMHKLAGKAKELKYPITQIVYGRAPMMVSSGCLKLTYDKCDKKTELSKNNNISDRKNSIFPVYNDCDICSNIIYNDRPLSLHNMYEKIAKIRTDWIRIDFTVEDISEVKLILDEYSGLMDENISSNVKEAMQKLEYTTGHIKRGV